MEPDPITLAQALAELEPSEREGHYTRMRLSAVLRAEVEALIGDETSRDQSAGRNPSASAASWSEPQAPTEGLPPRTIGRYEIVRLLGRGGMGDVYLAHDPVLDRDVAVKLIRGDFDAAAAHSRLVLEARTAGRLRHPNIVTIFDVGAHEGNPYIAMEYVPGETLRIVVRRRAELPLRRRLELIEGACAGLAHAHRAGVVHLDVKPDNLMLDDTGSVKVLDFGIARVLNSETAATNHNVGTLRYMSPEQVSGAPLDRRSDVFSLGASFFELVAYAPAYSGSTHEMITQIADGPVPRLLDVVPEVDPRVDAIVGRAMALDPLDRYDDLEELRLEIARIRDELDPESGVHLRSRVVSPEGARGTGSARSSRRVKPWRPGPVAALAAASAAAIGLVAIWMLGSQPASKLEVTVAPAPAGSRPTDPATGGDDAWRRLLALGDRPAESPTARPSPSSATPAPNQPLEAQPAPRTTVPESTEPAGGASPRPAAASTPVPVAPPAAATPPPSVETPAAPATVNPDRPAATATPDTEGVLAAVRRYGDAFKALDVSAVQQVFPTLGRDQVEQLRRTFAGMTAYEIEARPARVDVANDVATVRAVLARRMVPRVGRPVANEVETEFQLRREGRGWLITNVRAVTVP